MLEVPVYDIEGKQVETLQVDENDFGGFVNEDLLKQAVVAYHANKRQGSAANLTRGMVSGSTAKAYKQKGTGRARRGDMRTPLIRGGGRAFAKSQRDFRKGLPRKMRRRALQSAILAKMLGQDLLVLKGLAIAEPKTKTLVGILKNLKINRSCLLALADRDHNVHLSSRNIADLTVRTAGELNAFDVATRQKMIVTSEAMSALSTRESE
jgi:large subunit ribosomal protein L4